jgi:ankyrin repeat protein
MFRACYDGNAEAIVRLIKEDPTLIDCRMNVSGNIPLAIATFNGNTEVVRVLIAHGTKSFHTQSYYFGETPLHHAASLLSPVILEMMLNAGADVDNLNGYGITPLHSAASAGSVECVKALLGAGSKAIDTPDKKTSWTPMHYAAWSGHRRVMDALLEAGSLSLHTYDSCGGTPAQYIKKYESK